MSVCNEKPRGVWRRLRLAAIVAGVTLVAGCVPVDPGYDGYAVGTSYVPDYGYAPDYGYGGSVTVFGGGGYYGRPYYGGRYDRRPGWGGGHGGWRGHGGGQGWGGGHAQGYRPQGNRPFPGVSRGPSHYQPRPNAAPSGGGHGHGRRDWPR